MSTPAAQGSDAQASIPLLDADGKPMEESPRRKAEEVNWQLDIHSLSDIQVGLFPQAFDRVEPLGAVELMPTQHSNVIWRYVRKNTREEGCILDVAGYLLENQVCFPNDGRVYFSRHEGRNMGLLFYNPFRQLTVTKARYVPQKNWHDLLAHWPRPLIQEVIRYQLRRVVILNPDQLFQTMLGLTEDQ